MTAPAAKAALIGAAVDDALSPFAAADEARELKRPDYSLYEFQRRSWHVLEPETPYKDNWHIGLICEYLEAVTFREIRNLIINVPPGTMKSLLKAVNWPAWMWSFAAHLRFLFSSYDQKLSTRDSLKCRRLIKSDWYQRQWGHLFQMQHDQDAKMRYENTRMGYRVATQVGSGTGERADFIGVDDPHNLEERENEGARDKVIDWWKTTMGTRGADPTTFGRVVTMQRVHENDLSGYILANDLGYTHLVLPMEFDGVHRTSVLHPEGYDRRKEVGELLHPERFPRAVVEQSKHELGTYGAAAILQQQPAPAGGGIYKRIWFNFYTLPRWAHRHQGLPLLPPVFQEQMQSWDMAFKDLNTSSYVVGQVWARTGPNVYLLNQVRDKLDFVHTLRAVRYVTGAYPLAGAKLVEDKANGTAVINSLQTQIPGFIAIPGNDDKVATAYSVTWFVEAGNVYLPHPDIAPWVEELLLELERFPNSTYTDQAVCFGQALVRLITTIRSAKAMTRMVDDASKAQKTEAAETAAGRY